MCTFNEQMRRASHWSPELYLVNLSQDNKRRNCNPCGFNMCLNIMNILVVFYSKEHLIQQTQLCMSGLWRTWFPYFRQWLFLDILMPYNIFYYFYLYSSSLLYHSISIVIYNIIITLVRVLYDVKPIIYQGHNGHVVRPCCNPTDLLPSPSYKSHF